MKTEDQRRAKRGRLPMRRLMLLVFLASLAPYAGATKRVSVVQLEQALTNTQSAHKPDADLARQIGEVELSERLSGATLNRLSASLDPGSQAAQALRLLANQSAFLDPPASELPSTAAPDDAAQQRMIEAARTYVAKTPPQLPDLSAIRTTDSYDDRPQVMPSLGVDLQLCRTRREHEQSHGKRDNDPQSDLKESGDRGLSGSAINFD